MTSKWWRLSALVLLSGCGGSSSVGIQPTADEFASHEAAVAHRLAPDLYAAAERARREAHRAQDGGDEWAASDHLTRARLLLSAAIAEAERVGYEEKRLKAEHRIRQALEAARRDQAAQRAVNMDLTRQLASRTAKREMALALSLAQSSGKQRDRASPQAASQLREAAQSLLLRAQLILQTALALGAPELEVRRVEEAITRARGLTTPSELLRAADRAYAAASVVLGTVRRSLPKTPDSIAALAEEAEQAGFVVQQYPEGLSVRVEGLFRSRGSVISESQRPRIERLALLLRSHPAARVVVRTGGKDDRAISRRLTPMPTPSPSPLNVGSAEPNTVSVRTKAVVDALVRAGASRATTEGASVDTSLPESDVQLLFVEYGTLTPQ